MLRPVPFSEVGPDPYKQAIELSLPATLRRGDTGHHQKNDLGFALTALVLKISF